MGSIRITVRNQFSPRLESGHSYRIVDGREESRAGDYHIAIEVYESSDVSFSGAYMRIDDLDSVDIRETTQVAS